MKVETSHAAAFDEFSTVNGYDDIGKPIAETPDKSPVKTDHVKITHRTISTVSHQGGMINLQRGRVTKSPLGW